MKYKLELLIMASVLFCLSLTTVAPADSCVKTLYVDGAYIDYADVNQGLSWTYERITIGSESNRWYLYNGYIGKMDEFAIYAGVLDAGQIAAHYEAGSTDYAAYTAVVQADNPLLWLKFEDASTDHNDVADNSGSIGIDGAYISTGVGSITQTTGIAAGSTAIVLPGDEPDVNGNCVDVWDGNGDFGEDLDGDVTIELWVNYTDISDYPRFFQHNGSWQNEGSYGVMVNGPNQLGVIGGGTTNYMTTPSDINDGDWHHIVVTYDSTYEPPDTNSYPEEVMADNPFIWLRFDYEAATDSSGNGNWVGYGNVDIVTAGGIGKSALQDTNDEGSGNYAAAAAKGPDAPPYEEWDQAYALAPNDITIEFWYKSLPAGGDQPGQYVMLCQQIGKWQNEPNGPAIGTADGQIRVFCGAPGHGTGIWYTGRYPYDGAWHHIVVTYDEEYQDDPCSIHMQLYYDGDLSEHTSTDPRIGLYEGLGVELSHMILGAANNRGYSYSIAPGYYDEFAIYDGILGADRVMAHYLAWQPRDCEEVWDRGGGIVADMDKDCDVDFRDFAMLASYWLLCNDPGSSDPNCVPNW